METKTFDKTRVLKTHLETATILVSLEESYVSAHTIIMAAEELFRHLYVKRNLYVEFDYRIYIKDEHQQEYLNKTREKYNFFKHADRDTDATIDVDSEQLHQLNHILLGLLIYGWRQTFKTPSEVMDVYGRWFAAAYPDYIHWNKITGGERLKASLETIPKDPLLKRQLLRVMLYAENILQREDFELLKIYDTLR